MNVIYSCDGREFSASSPQCHMMILQKSF